MSLVPGKIVLKSSTSKTLSDRFGEIAKTTHIENVRTTQREESYASLKNRRLAAHMAKRLKQAEEPPLPPPSPKKNPIKSRLGLPITSRLGNKRGGAIRGRGGRGRTGQRMTRGTQGTTTGPVRLQRGGAQGRRGGRGQSRGQTRGQTRGRVTTRGRDGGRGRGAANQFTQRGRGGRARGGRGRGRGKKPVSQAQLDTELDTYMSKTKSVLNAQLDQYMKAAGE